MNAKFKQLSLMSKGWHNGSNHEAMVQSGLNAINMWIELIGSLLCFQRGV